MITPSAGTRPPDRTRTTSSGRSSLAGTLRTPPSSTRSASSGSSAASASKAPEAWPRARISSQWPSSMMSISSASSHQKSRSKAPSAVAALALNATVMARAISSIMPGWRVRASSMPPRRNGQPP